MKKKILIVDDEPNILRALAGPLTREGYDVETAESYADAVGINDGDFAVVLLDVCLPDGDGVALLGQFAREFPDQVHVMMSGHSTIGTAVKAVKLGAFDFLEKPLSLEKVLVTLENALRFGRLREENKRLKRDAGERHVLIGVSEATQSIREQIKRAAESNARIFIRGESGTGKEVVARLIHATSERSAKPFVPVNCAAVPGELIESELFGHRKGAFTGATSSRTGRFEEADGGTLFLDEIGDMHLRAQAKLLRAIEEGEIERVGGGRIEVDVRIIAATNKNLEKMISDGKFREDLFFRINVYPIEIPPLRSRRDDIEPIAKHFIERICNEYGKKLVKLRKDAARALQKLDFPGNVRELRNLIERTLINNSFTDIDSASFSQAHDFTIQTGDTTKKLREATDDFERRYVARVIMDASGNMTEAAARLGLERSHLYKKIKALGIDKQAG